MTHTLQPNDLKHLKLPTFENQNIPKSRKFHNPISTPIQNNETFCDCCPDSLNAGNLSNLKKNTKNDSKTNHHCNNSLTNQWHDCGIAERLFKKFTPEIIVKLCDNHGFETLIRHEDHENGGVRIILDIQPKIVKNVRVGEIQEISISIGGEKKIKKVKNVRTHVKATQFYDSNGELKSDAGRLGDGLNNGLNNPWDIEKIQNYQISQKTSLNNEFTSRLSSSDESISLSPDECPFLDSDEEISENKADSDQKKPRKRERKRRLKVGPHLKKGPKLGSIKKKHHTNRRRKVPMQETRLHKIVHKFKHPSQTRHC